MAGPKSNSRRAIGAEEGKLERIGAGELTGAKQRAELNVC
jgi:hypothetical protein